MERTADRRENLLSMTPTTRHHLVDVFQRRGFDVDASWLPLVWRAQLKHGETVLILGATGVAGKLAVQISKHLGAGRVVAAGRNEQVLKTVNDLGADATIRLDRPDEELAEAFTRELSYRRFDVVIDYLWGHPTEVLLDTFIEGEGNKNPAN
jgi:NADPH:quinone reductase-like Zn-dependent oxidoreductase